MERHTLRGGRLRSAAYDSADRILEIEFDNRDVRRYQNVPVDVWRKLLSAPNPATFHEDRIEEEYAWQRGERELPDDARRKLDDLFG